MAALSTKVWDVIMTSGSTTIGLMEPRGRNGAKPTAYRDGQIVPPRQMTDAEFTEVQYPPTVQLPLPQSDWQVGLGRTHRRLDIAAFGGTTIGYQNGLKVDASGEAMVKLGRKLTATAYSAAQGATTKGAGGMGAIGADLWLIRDFDAGDILRGFKWNYTNRNWVLDATVVTTAGSGKLSPNGIVYKSNLYFPVWTHANKTTALAYRYIAEGAGTFTISTLAVNDFYFMAVDAGNVWYGAYRPSDTDAVYTATDPTNAGATTGPYAVGFSDTEITAIVPYGLLMLICKPEGIFTITSAGVVVNLSKDIFYGLRHDDNFRNACNVEGKVLLPLGEGGMWELAADGTLRDISFKLVAPEQTYLHGSVINLVAVPGGVQALVADGATVYIMFGEWLAINGVTDWRWHVVGSTTWTETAIDKYRQFMFAQGYQSGADLYRRVWISRSGSDTSTTVGNQFLPRLNDRDDAFTTDSTAVFDTVIEDAYLPNETKNYLSVICTTDNLGTGGTDHTIPVDYSVDDGAFTSLGTLNSDSQTLTFTAITGKKLVLRFKPLLGTPTSPITSPELLDFRIVVQVRPPPTKVLTTRVILGDGIPNKLGARETRTGSKLSQLRTWNASAGAVTAKHAFLPAGDSYLFLSGSMRERIISQKRGERPVYQIDLVLLEI